MNREAWLTERATRRAARGITPDADELAAMSVQELHAWTDALEAVSVPENYYLKVLAGRRERQREDEAGRGTVAPSAPPATFREGVARLRAALHDNPVTGDQ